MADLDPIERANQEFVRRSMAVPLLSKDKEQSLAIAWRDDQDERSLHQLIDAYRRLVIATASKFRNYGLPSADLIQEGMMGLMHAANRFEPERDLRFSTYANWWIRSSMQDFVLRNWSIVRTGTTASQKSLFFNLRRLRAKIEEDTGQPLDGEGRESIADTLGVSVAEVESMEQRLTRAYDSLNAPLKDDSDMEAQDLLSDDRPDPAAAALVTMDGQSRTGWINEAIGTLGEREQIIIRERRLSDEGLTLEELGQRFGVSKERVRQLEQRALSKLKDHVVAKVASPQDLLHE